MTVSTTDNVAGPFNGNDVAIDFPFSFKVLSNTDMAVIHTDSVGLETTLTENIDYTLTLNADQELSPGGNIRYPISGSPLPTGEKITGVRSTQRLQGVDLVNQGAYLPEVVETALDKAILAAQDLAEQVARSVKVPVSSSDDPDALITSIKTSESNAAASAVQASAEVVNAQAEVANAKAWYDLFRGEYYGALAANPTQDPNGNAPTDGDYYFNTTAKEVRFYDAGTDAWIAAGAGAVLQQTPTDITSGRAVSTDGLVAIRGALVQGLIREFQAKSSTADISWRRIIWAPVSKRFVTVGAGGVGNGVSTSFYGGEWSAKAPPADQAWRGVAEASTNGRLLAVSQDGSSFRSMWSNNGGDTWAAVGSDNAYAWGHVVWSPPIGKFLAVTTGQTPNYARHMTDGIVWDAATAITGADALAINDLIWAPGPDLYVALYTSGVFTSPDGNTWTQRDSGIAAPQFSCIAYSPELNLYVACSDALSGKNAYTYDFVTWTQTPLASNAIVTGGKAGGIAWSPELGLFVAVDNSTTRTDNLHLSHDGKNWTRGVAGALDYNNICWSSDVGRFVAVANSGAGNRFWASA